MSHTWIDILNQNKESKKTLTEYKNFLKYSFGAQSISQKEIAGSILSELDENIKEAEKRILYEFNVYSDEDIMLSKLTDCEIEILKYRNIYNRYSDIAAALEMTPQSVFKIYINAIKKIKKYNSVKRNNKGILNMLSPQQLKIYELMVQEKSNSEISSILGISPSVVKTQKCRIKKLNINSKISNTCEKVKVIAKVASSSLSFHVLKAFLDYLYFFIGTEEKIKYDYPNQNKPNSNFYKKLANKIIKKLPGSLKLKTAT